MSSLITLIRDLFRRETPFGEFPKDHVLYENFSELPGSATSASLNKHFVYGGNGTPIVTQLTGGGILLSTRTAGTADNDTARVVPASTSGWSKTTLPAEKPILDVVVRTPAAVTLMQIYAGFKLTGTDVLATDANQALFFYDTDDTLNFGTAGVGTVTATANWMVANSSGGDDVAYDTGIPVVADTNYRLTITIDASRRTRFYIDGVQVLDPTTDGDELVGAAIGAAAALLTQIGVSTRDPGATVRTIGIRNARLQRPLL